MNEKPVPPDDAFLTAVRRVLDESVDRMDPWQTGRLQRARCEALGSSARPLKWARWAAGLAVVCIGLLSLVFVLHGTNREGQSPPLLEDLDLVTSAENADLSEDWEFYDWLSDSDALVSRS